MGDGYDPEGTGKLNSIIVLLEKIIALRKDLHQHPELSGVEMETAGRIKLFIEKNCSAKIIDNLGGNGLAAIFEYFEKGPTILIRCELDALPINEPNPFDYKSTRKNISHKCGHDGHMSILAGLIFWIKKQAFKKGKIVLLFQPAEETGRGAEAVINDPKFSEIIPDYIFALHNIPGEPLHSVICLEKHFSPSVLSLAIYLKGKESHASEPENGINPALAISELIQKLEELNVKNPHNKYFALLTPVHVNMGQRAYGISAGEGDVHYTIRTWTETEMKKLKNKIIKTAKNICLENSLEFKIDWFEYFPATKNDSFCNQLIYQAAQKNNFKIIKQDLPFKFGEDFGWFSQKYKAAMFGLGAGVDSPALHHAEYDFPDVLIPTGMRMFEGIIEGLLNE